jgi:DNA-binding LytR/AlgR family response regulator
MNKVEAINDGRVLHIVDGRNEYHFDMTDDVISHILADGNFVDIYLASTNHVYKSVRAQIGMISKALKQMTLVNLLYRADRSTIINLRFLESLDDHKKVVRLRTNNGIIELKIAKSKIVDLRERLNLLLEDKEIKPKKVYDPITEAINRANRALALGRKLLEDKE